MHVFVQFYFIFSRTGCLEKLRNAAAQTDEENILPDSTNRNGTAQTNDENATPNIQRRPSTTPQLRRSFSSIDDNNFENEDDELLSAKRSRLSTGLKKVYSIHKYT